MKYSGEIGFSLYKETAQDVWKEEITEKHVYGDVLENRRSWQERNEVNDDLTIQNRISIVANSFVKKNIGAMRYATYGGSKWEITNVDIIYPRIILTLGGVWNGSTEIGDRNDSPEYFGD